MLEEEKIFEERLKNKNLKHSKQRIEVLKTFTEIEKHLTTDELYRIVKEKNPAIGYATVYRTLKLLCECGLCRELKFEDGIARYEHLYGHEHHDHLVCLGCGKSFEFSNKNIEKLQRKIAKEKNFLVHSHRLEIYGYCQKCQNTKK